MGRTKLNLQIPKKCFYCENPLHIKINRDIERKKFCSYKCNALYHLNIGIIGMRGKTHSGETRKKMGKPRNLTEKFLKAQIERGLKLRQENHPNWKGGLTDLTRMRTNLSEWRRIARQVMERDSYKCKLCPEVENLSVHHIIPWNISKDDSPQNLVTLCRPCHTKVEWKWENYKPQLIELISRGDSNA